uniref:SD-repeat containing protein B domain-containing protein n=1 Tax=Glossina pallidipes TaxID=7398 RepID=A0A1B0A9B7_GLOPL
MYFNWNFFVILLIKVFTYIRSVKTNEVVGCGGFIKSHAEIDFSKVEVKLLTKNGALKDKTDCSPSNGYYFLPIYDKGDYVLRIAPPPGWSFEPKEVKLTFDGKTDICSLGHDINFAFKGFGITGRVILGSSGARGIQVQLRSLDGRQEHSSATTDINGVFSFTPIIPGEYELEVVRAKWHFEKAKHIVVVKEGNTELPVNALTVSGFDVGGRFETTHDLDLMMVLFKEKGDRQPTACPKQIICALAKHDNDLYELTPFIFAEVSSSGDYLFSNVAPGKYLLMPLQLNSNLKLHWEPRYYEFQVNKDYVEIKTAFKIDGFNVEGQVLRAVRGSPLSQAAIKLNGQQVTVTDNKGFFTLAKIPSAGTYTIQVEAPRLEFPAQQIQLQLNTFSIPPVVPSGYEVCGVVVTKSSYTVAINEPQSGFFTTVNTNAESGVWCTFLPAGKFNVEVEISKEDKANGVQFYPLQQNIEVKNQPLDGITFSQLRATVHGMLKCLNDAPRSVCLETEVTLNNLDASGQVNGQKLTINAKDGRYSFKNVLPGPYEVTIPRYKLCFNSTRLLINVNSVVTAVPDFEQHGYEVDFISSHRAMLTYSHNSNPNFTSTLKLLAGHNALCVQKYGIYYIKLEGCHLYDPDSLPLSFSTADPSSIVINAIAHKVGLRFLLPKPLPEKFQLYVESQSLGKQWVTPLDEGHIVDEMFCYRYDTHLKPEEVLYITPRSEVLLFEPSFKQLTGGNDCVDIAFTFVASRGLILQGNVMPAIKDAKITLSFPQNPELKSQTYITTEKGEFKFGPIHQNLHYELKGEKESYVFSEYDHATATFKVHKLCEIIVNVRDEAGKQLSGVLISMSGGESYRKNLITGENGQIVFHSLAPSQYFLRPMMKEFKFEPNSKMIELKNGETIEMEMIGKRVAHSVFGNVVSLNGEPFSQVNVQANAGESCMYHQEEATTDANGQYRLRGLQPGCEYTIRIKDFDTKVHRSIPPKRIVKVAHEDVRAVNFVGISPLGNVDVVCHVTAPSNDFYKTLRVVLYRKGAYDTPLHTQRMETLLNPKGPYSPGILVFFPSIPLDHKTTYIIELRTTLSESTYTYTLPSKQFLADKGTIYLELHFKPKLRAIDIDLNHNSISALILLALVAIAFFKQDIAITFLNFIWTRASALIENFTQQQKHQNKNNTRKIEPINQKEIELMAEQINATKKKKPKKI